MNAIQNAEPKPMFFVTTNERTERFHTNGAALYFIELHCDPRTRRNPERLISTNANSHPHT